MVDVGEQSRDGLTDLHLLFMGEHSGDDDVIQRLFRVQTEPIRDGLNSLGAEVAFGIKVNDFALPSPHLKR